MAQSSVEGLGSEKAVADEAARAFAEIPDVEAVAAAANAIFRDADLSSASAGSAQKTARDNLLPTATAVSSKTPAGAVEPSVSSAPAATAEGGRSFHDPSMQLAPGAPEMLGSAPLPSMTTLGHGPASPGWPAPAAFPATSAPPGFSLDPLQNIAGSHGAFDHGAPAPFGFGSAMPTVPAVPSTVAADPTLTTRTDPAAAIRLDGGARDALATMPGAGIHDVLHPDVFGFLANSLFRGDTMMPQSRSGASSDPYGVAKVDPLRPDAFSAIANSLFQGSQEGAPAAAQPPSSYTSHAQLMSDRSAEMQRPAMRYDIESTRDDFPILNQKVHGKPLVWLDNAATTQKPRQVVERIRRFYYEDNSNVHRGAHTLAARATDAYEEARSKIANFLGAGVAQEIVFVRGTTEAINLVAASFGRLAIGADDEIILSELEHHSNIVPWQLLAQRTGARLRVAPIDNNGDLRMDDYAALLNRRTRLVAMTHVSNAIGTVLPVKEITAMAHRAGARVLIDGAQSVQHMPLNVQDIGCDFFCFSGHKIFGPSGVGALFARAELLQAMPPWQGGGSMIENVTFEQSTYAPPPAKFEAGTPILAGAVGLGAAVDYVTQVGLPIIERHESALMSRAVEGLGALKRVRLIGNPKHRAGALSFVIEGMDVTSIGARLDQEGIAVRAGHHCAQPALAHFGLKASVRPSFALYNNAADVDALVAAIERIIHSSP